jgi:hypothetical protein
MHINDSGIYIITVPFFLNQGKMCKKSPLLLLELWGKFTFIPKKYF